MVQLNNNLVSDLGLTTRKCLRLYVVPAGQALWEAIVQWEVVLCPSTPL